jgi:threonine dehydratase
MIDRERIAATAELIRPYVRVTPVIEVDSADFGRPGFTLVLKLEALQHAGSFKTRGAFANLLARKVPAAGVVAASGGNHGVAVAYAAMRLSARAKIFVPTVSSAAKVQRIRDYGADLVVTGDRYADALAASETWVVQSGAMAVHAFDQVDTLLGQGTIGLELDAQKARLDTLLVSVGGGGLIGGIAAWFGRTLKVIGVEPEAAPTLAHALAADSLAPRRVGELMFPIAWANVDRVVLVSDDDIRRAQQALWASVRVVAEPGGVASLAGVLSGRYVPAPGERVGVLISGGNTTAVAFDAP